MPSPRVFTIRKNTKRYDEIDRTLPSHIFVSNVTLEQAIIIADRLSIWNAGCDFSWYVVGDPEGEEPEEGHAA